MPRVRSGLSLSQRRREAGREFAAVASVLADVAAEMNERVKVALPVADQ